jgi:quinol monooxygenase YgiN
MSKYRAVARFKIHPGKSEEFKRIAAESLAVVRAKDPGTSTYEWFINEAQNECIVLETYESAEDLLAHGRNVGRLVGTLLQISDCTVDMLADPTPEVRSLLQRMPMTLFGRLQGLE